LAVLAATNDRFLAGWADFYDQCLSYVDIYTHFGLPSRTEKWDALDTGC